MINTQHRFSGVASGREVRGGETMYDDIKTLVDECCERRRREHARGACPPEMPGGIPPSIASRIKTIRKYYLEKQ